MIKIFLAVGGLVLFLIATLAALATGFTAPTWVVPVAGACVAGALLLHLLGR